MARESAKRRAPQARAVSVQSESDDRPSVWARKTADGTITFGVSKFGRNVAAAGRQVRAEFLRMMHFVEVEIPEELDKYRQENLRLSAARQSAPPSGDEK